VDGDDGYGNHLNVIRLVREMQAAGAAAIHLEDQVLPKKCGHMDGKQVIPTSRFVDKIKAFVDTRTSDKFLLFARTDALAVNGYEDAIERANRYVEAGADVIFVEALSDDGEIRRLPKDVPAPLLYNWVFGGKSPLLHKGELRELGYTHMLQADVLYAVAPALESYFHDLKSTGTYGQSAQTMWNFDRFNETVGYAETSRQDRLYRHE
jgi:methylisocitrate lyase